MQPSTRRVRTIYSVIASPNRLEILRILNSKGPLTYSELKTLAGFKSKKESGKFAYHLRKLVRQMLVVLNRSERRYTVTSLGRLVLNLTRQIEEQSMLESGKLYVRTSRQAMEEFNADKITQSLVREAGMPVELAQKITSEAEARVYKFQTTYLTAPLIREIVNAILIEQGYEGYRHRLTRLGLPVYDVDQLLTRVGESVYDIEFAVAQTAQSVFSEHLLLARLPKDVADAHLAGDIHLSQAGSWELVPDTLFVNLQALSDGGLNIDGKLPSLPRIGLPRSVDDALSSFIILSSILCREASVEVCYEGFTQYLANFSKATEPDELRQALLRTFTLIPTALGTGFTHPNLSIQVGSREKSEDAPILKILEEVVLKAYSEYVSLVPIPAVGLVLKLNPKEVSPSTLATISTIVQNGGRIAISTEDHEICSLLGVKRSVGRKESDGGVTFLHSLSLNLPRLARESGRDETYFRAKLALLIQLGLNALTVRKKAIQEAVRSGLLPLLNHNPGLISLEQMVLLVNFTGLNEASLSLLGERASTSARKGMVEKIIDTAVRTISDRAEKAGEKGDICIIQDGAGERFATLDAERYGKPSVALEERSSYSQAPQLKPQQLFDDTYIDELNSLYQKLKGGFSLSINIPNEATLDDISKTVAEALVKLPFFRLSKEVKFCRSCGAKLVAPLTRCKVCRSASLMDHRTL